MWGITIFLYPTIPSYYAGELIGKIERIKTQTIPMGRIYHKKYNLF